MAIVFFCQSCGARFEVDARMAGKKGRCQKCGQYTSIPRAEEIASMSIVALPALAGAASAAGAGSVAVSGAQAPAPAGAEEGSAIGSRVKTSLSKLALAPISVDKLPRIPRQPSPVDDAQDSKPYVLATPLVEHRGRVRVQDNVILRFWRRELGGIQKFFRKINETAYLVSIPFLMILLLGAAVRNRPMALFGATVVVLLNIGRLAAGCVNLAVVPFRDGINLEKMKKPLRRVVEPAVTIGLVILVFTFIPWLSTGKAASGSITDRLRAGTESLEKEITGEVEKLGEKAKALDLEKLGAQAQEKLKGLGSRSGEGAPNSSKEGGTGQTPESAIRGLIKDVGQRARQTIEDSQPQP
jgi:hypothetical protein